MRRFTDEQLTCIECGTEFIFSVGEQQFYSAKKLSLPKRCKACRDQRKQTHQEEKRIRNEHLYEEILKGYTVHQISDIQLSNPLYIIGNGFDLMHGVPSSYSNFKQSLGKHSDLRQELEIYLNSESIWSDFEEALGHLNYSMMMNADVIDMMLDDYGAYDPDAQAADFYAAVDSITTPAVSITDGIERRFRKWIDSLDCDTNSRPLQGLFIQGKVLCFNYTEFIEELYDVPNESICYIHGCRRKIKGKPKEKLILGHLPGVENEEWEKVNVEPPRYKDPYKHYIFEAAADTAARNLIWYDEETTKKCSEIIKRHQAFFDELSDIKEVVVIGHSLSRVDWDYFEEIINKSDVQRWFFSCHSLEGLRSIETFIAHFGIAKKDITVFKT